MNAKESNQNKRQKQGRQHTGEDRISEKKVEIACQAGQNLRGTWKRD